MKSSFSVQANFETTLARAFKTPMLSDTTEILTGHFLIPPVTGFTDDGTWGRVDGFRIPHSAGNIVTPKGPMADDRIMERKENEYWQWQVDNFRPWSLFFAKKAVGEFWSNETSEGKVAVKWTYTYYARNLLTQPMNWLFVQLIWSGLMKKAILNMKRIAESDAPFVHP